MKRLLASLTCCVLLAVSVWGCAACGPDKPDPEAPREAPVNPAFEEWRKQQEQKDARPDAQESEPPAGYVPPPVSPPESARDQDT
ncbi:hypothetical protein PCS_02775 [Desulfocurvibacter africanus PCS]|uniref:Lipoprotein n=1 Tax=Desulfocurvibacter africanus PCS TaxID=1262666 RepID=M5PPQ0_DESAF|nr:hypothetical protein [Desulfocurvibacter africanus]EMG36272.1 hypothetical protein PCS_02775 [Desulfocurvibacter africanus PCS]